MPLGMEIGLGLHDTVGRGPSSPSTKGAQPPNFRPVSVVAKWLDGSICDIVLDGVAAPPRRGTVFASSLL